MEQPHLFDPDTHTEALPGLWSDPVRYGPSTIVPAPFEAVALLLVEVAD